MIPRDLRLLHDILAAIAAIDTHLARGPLSDGLVFDAVRMRLIEIGEASKGLSLEAQEREPSIPWQDIERMRDHLAHRSFDTLRAIVQGTVDNDLKDLRHAVDRLLEAT